MATMDELQDRIEDLEKNQLGMMKNMDSLIGLVKKLVRALGPSKQGEPEARGRTAGGA